MAVDASRSALAFVHRLLNAPDGEQPDLAGLLAELAGAFAVPVVGLATLPEGTPVRVHDGLAGLPIAERPLPWGGQPDVLDRALRAPTALRVPLASGGSALLAPAGAPDRGGWVLWLEDAGRTGWSHGEAAALCLAGQALGQRLKVGGDSLRWAEQLDRSVRKQKLEAVAHAVRRVAHDFGNVLTGVLGFSELGLAQQLAPGSSLHAFLTEIHRSAQNGAQYTNQLRLFARRQTSATRSCSLSAVLAEEEKRLRPTLTENIRLHVEVPPGLAALALEADLFRQVLAVLLDNAHEAIAGAGTITVLARHVELSDGEARDLFGDARPGPGVEITVADTGSGLAPEARRQLFAEPFFTTKPRKRGFGLAIAYGIVTAHRGGLELLDRPTGGTTARVVLPAAGPVATCTAAPAQAARGERVLVVDDDPMILQFVSTTLESAGFRVRAVASAEDALRSYADATGEPFHLVLSDVLMPGVNGVDLARSLLAYDANVRVLFMSGQVPAETIRREFSPGRFDLLSKPFRPDGLVRAVRAAIAGERAG